MTVTDEDAFNDFNRLHYTILGDPANLAAIKALLDVGSISMDNGTIVASRAANAETIAIKTLAGADPSATDPVVFTFRDAAATTGGYVVVRATAALSLTVSSGSTLGMTNSEISRLWLVVFNDGGTLRLGVVNTRSATNIMALGDDRIMSSTAEGGLGAADSAQVIYTGTAVTSKAMRVLGYLEYTLAAVGTWGTAPSKIQLLGPGVPLPGTPVQRTDTQTGATASGSTIIPLDDTIPQNTEGDQYLSVAITPSSAANVLRIRTEAALSPLATAVVVMALYQDAVANALAATAATMTGNDYGSLVVSYAMLASTTSSTTFKMRAGPHIATTLRLNGVNGVRAFGGSYMSSTEVVEIQA